MKHYLLKRNFKFRTSWFWNFLCFVQYYWVFTVQYCSCKCALWKTNKIGPLLFRQYNMKKCSISFSQKVKNIFVPDSGYYGILCEAIPESKTSGQCKSSILIKNIVSFPLSCSWDVTCRDILTMVKIKLCETANQYIPMKDYGKSEFYHVIISISFTEPGNIN